MPQYHRENKAVSTSYRLVVVVVVVKGSLQRCRQRVGACSLNLTRMSAKSCWGTITPVLFNKERNSMFFPIDAKSGVYDVTLCGCLDLLCENTLGTGRSGRFLVH